MGQGRYPPLRGKKDFRCGKAMYSIRNGNVHLDSEHSDKAAELGLSKAGYVRWFYDLDNRDREVHGSN